LLQGKSSGATWYEGAPDVLFFIVGLIFLLSAVLGASLRKTGIVGSVFPLLMFVAGMTTAYLWKNEPDLKPLIVLPGFFLAMGVGYICRYLSDVNLQKKSAFTGLSITLRLLTGDFRVAALLVGLLISYALSYYFYELAIRGATTDFWMSFFASWMSGLLFFTVVGLVAGLVTLYRPERDIFAARVKILLGGQSGAAVDFLSQSLAKIGYVAKRTERIIVIEEYSREMDAFKIRITHSSTIRNLYHDVATQADGRIAFHLDQLDPAPAVVGQLTSFRLNGTTRPGLPLALPTIDRPIPWELPIQGGDEGTVQYEHWCWYNSSVIHSFKLARFTEELTVRFICRCTPDGKRLKLNLTAGANTDEPFLEWDQSYALPPMRDQRPQTNPYSFKVSLGP
jgi:hypothetical protein